jgi:hypothetical protein
MAELKGGMKYVRKLFETFRCGGGGECNVDYDNRKYVNDGNGTDSNSDLCEVLQTMKKCVETTADHADWRW